MPFVLDLGDPRAADAALVGPKAAHLSALTGVYPVPAGFCLTAAAYRHAQRVGGFDAALTRAVTEAHARLVGDAPDPPSVAVRSSALDEDGPAASFAGQHDTLLAIVGVDATLDAIEAIWASLRSEAALAYHRSHGLPSTNLALAVIVQRLVIADASGVAFSVEPVSGRRDRVVVNGSWGLGESMVGGTVTPDTWTLDKATLALLDTRLSDKARMTVAVDGATREVAVPAFLRGRAALDEHQILEVATMARSLEARQGWPVDIEFAVADGHLHLLQCRPVTGLADAPAAVPDPLDGFPAPWSEPADAGSAWRRDRMHFPGQLTLLAGELARIAIETGANHGYEHYDIAARMTVRRFWTRYYDTSAPFVAPEGEREGRRARGRAAAATALADLEAAWATRWLPEIDDHLGFWSGFDLEGATIAGLLEHLDETRRRLERLWRLHFEIVIPGFQARSSFHPLYCELFEDATELDAFALLQGIDSLTTEAGAALWRVRDVVAGVPGLADEVRALPAAAVVAALVRRPEARPALEALQAYLAAYGRRVLYLAVSAPSLAEDPTPVVAMLQDALARPDHDQGRHHATLAATRDRKIADARARLRHYPSPVREAFDARLAAAQTAFRIEEDHAFLIDFGGTAAVRRVFLELGRRFADAARIETPDDVVHLSWDEVRATTAAFPTLDRRALVAERRAEMVRYANVEPPERIGEPPTVAAGGDDFFGRTPPTTTEAGVVTGNPGSSGTVRGRARVLRRLSDAGRLEPGEVLVATTTSQPWTPLFAIAAALVTDTGGVLSHTAVVAREYGLPAVVGTGVATSVLRDGMLLEVDGDRGWVQIVDDG